MSEPDTAAIRDYHHCYGGYGYGCDDGTVREQCLVSKLCDALDAARTEQLSAIREAVGDCCGYRTRAEAAEARIAAALELCEEFRRGEYDVQPAIAVERFRRALTGGTDG